MGMGSVVREQYTAHTHPVYDAGRMNVLCMGERRYER